MSSLLWVFQKGPGLHMMVFFLYLQWFTACPTSREGWGKSSCLNYWCGSLAVCDEAVSKYTQHAAVLCCGFRVCRTLWILIVVDVLSLKGRISVSVIQANRVVFVVTYLQVWAFFSPSTTRKSLKLSKSQTLPNKTTKWLIDSFFWHLLQYRDTGRTEVQ